MNNLRLARLEGWDSHATAIRLLDGGVAVLQRYDDASGQWVELPLVQSRWEAGAGDEEDDE